MLLLLLLLLRLLLFYNQLVFLAAFASSPNAFLRVQFLDWALLLAINPSQVFLTLLARSTSFLFFCTSFLS